MPSHRLPGLPLLGVLERQALLLPGAGLVSQRNDGHWTIPPDDYDVDATWTFKVATEVDCGICEGTGRYPKDHQVREFAGTPCDWCDSTGRMFLDQGAELSGQLIDVPGEFDDVQAEYRYERGPK